MSLDESPSDSELDLDPHEDIIERAAPGEQPLLLWAQTCPIEDCPCRAVLVVAAESREQLDAHVSVVRAAWQESENDTDFVAAIPNDAVVFEVDIDSGEVTMPMSESKELSAAVARVAQLIDGDLLDRFASQWYLGKEMPDATSEPVAPASIRDYKVGQLLAWDEVYAGARMDIYAQGGAAVEAIETYCVRPKCECNDVHIQFYELPASAMTDADELDSDEDDDSDAPDDHDDDEHVFVGTVSIKVEEPIQIAYEPDQGQAGRLEDLFKLYQARYPSWAPRLARRADLMAAFGEKLHTYLEQQRRKPWVSTSRKRKGGARRK